MDRFLLSSLDSNTLLNIADWPPKIDNKYLTKRFSSYLIITFFSCFSLCTPHLKKIVKTVYSPLVHLTNNDL